MVAAIELVKNKETRERYRGLEIGMRCREHCFQNGLVMRAVGDTMIIAPPLVISPAQIDELLEKAFTCLDLTLKEVQAGKKKARIGRAASCIDTGSLPDFARA